MHLLAQRRRISLHERIHILPAIQLSHAADFRLRDRLGGIPRPVAENQPLDVGGPDLASVIEHLARGRDEDLRRVETG